MDLMCETECLCLRNHGPNSIIFYTVLWTCGTLGDQRLTGPIVIGDFVSFRFRLIRGMLAARSFSPGFSQTSPAQFRVPGCRNTLL